MLEITVYGPEFLNESTSEIFREELYKIQLEHSLVSLSKWEMKHERAFLSLKNPTVEDALSYIECMITTPDFPPDVLDQLTKEDFDTIQKYIDAKMSATYFAETGDPPKSKETVTSELIYYWLATLNVPFHLVENWHLNRLFNLIKIADLKNAKPKKMSRGELNARNRKLNEERRRQYNTTG